MTTMQTSADAFVADWQQWFDNHQAVLGDPHGFLAITSLNFLTNEPRRFADAPGAWSTDENAVRVTLDAGERLVVDGEVIQGEHRFDVIPERGGINVVSDDAVIEIAKRGGYDIVRPRHPDNPLVVAFAGTPAYAPDPKWRVVGQYVAYDEPRPVTVGAAVEGLQHVYDSPGRIEIHLAGQALQLTAFNGKRPGSLMVLFTDETSGVTTYAANRALQIDAPDGDGHVVVDFNRAANLPCAYTDLATCPLPPAENRLPVAVEAGEQIPYERTGQGPIVAN